MKYKWLSKRQKLSNWKQDLSLNHMLLKRNSSNYKGINEENKVSEKIYHKNKVSQNHHKIK